MGPGNPAVPTPMPSLYTAAERARRDQTRWTQQGILAPLQFFVFAVSLPLVLRTMSTGEGYALAQASILLKTALLYLIMVTVLVGKGRVRPLSLRRPLFLGRRRKHGVIVLHSAVLLAIFCP